MTTRSGVDRELGVLKAVKVMKLLQDAIRDDSPYGMQRVAQGALCFPHKRIIIQQQDIIDIAATRLCQHHIMVP